MQNSGKSAKFGDFMIFSAKFGDFMIFSAKFGIFDKIV
jgi:hypothetical protein